MVQVVGRILVPVATGEDFDRAVRYAAAQARLRGCGVHVVTVLHPVYLGPPPVQELTLVEGELRVAGNDVLARASQLVHELTRDVDPPISTELLHGPLVSSLVDLSASAGLVVMQRRHHAPLVRVVTMSVTSGVAARAHVPVVVVPHRWRGEPVGAPVVVGVEDPGDLTASAHLLRHGLESARREGRSLRIAHAWWYTDAWDDLVFADPVAERQSHERRAALAATLAPLLEEYADVRVDLMVRHARPADLLVRAADGAASLVVGRHHPSFPRGSHLGPITRAVLREAACPVVVVPAPPEPEGATA